MPTSTSPRPMKESARQMPVRPAMSTRNTLAMVSVTTAPDAAGSAAALALALTLALERGWLTIGLALMAPGIAWVAGRRPLPLLRWLAAAAAVLVLARFGWEPRIAG